MMTRFSRCGTKYRRATSRTCSADTFWIPATYTASNSGSPAVIKLRPRLSASCCTVWRPNTNCAACCFFALANSSGTDQFVPQPIHLAENPLRRLLPGFRPADRHHGKHAVDVVRRLAGRVDPQHHLLPVPATAASTANSLPRRECPPPRPTRTDRDWKASPSARRTPCRRWPPPSRGSPRAAKAAPARPRTQRRSPGRAACRRIASPPHRARPASSRRPPPRTPGCWARIARGRSR